MLKKTIIHSILGALLSLSARAQDRPGQYMVFFRDKQGVTAYHSIDQPSSFLSQRSIDRRQRQGIAITEEDLPVSPEYTDELGARNISIRYTLRWFNGALVELKDNNLEALQNLVFISRIEYVAPLQDPPENQADIQEVASPTEGLLRNAAQLAMPELDRMHEEKLFGEGVHIAVFDGGFPGVDSITPFALLFQENRIEYTYDFLGGSSNVFQYSEHGTEVLSTMAAYLPNTYIGGSYKATYQLYVTENTASEYRIEEYHWTAAAERADSAGADIISTSVGYTVFDDPTMNYRKEQLDGETSIISQAAKKALSKGISVIVSTGNEGREPWESITFPADVEGVIAVGGATENGQRASFSSTGPTADGRVKPDVMMLGVNIAVFDKNGQLNLSRRGTSYASPSMTSLAAGLLQQYPNLTPENLYRLIIHSGTQNAEPDNERGYGIPRYTVARNLQVTALPQKNTSTNTPFLLSPNPVSGRYMTLHINTGGSPQNTPDLLTLSIYTPEGKRARVYTQWASPQKDLLKYDISTLGTGVYLIKIKYQNDSHRLRLIKE